MKILFVSLLTNKPKIVSGDYVPQVGDFVDMFYEPLPVVKSVVAYPQEATLTKLGVLDQVSVMVFVE